MSQQQFNEQASFLYQSSGTINNFNQNIQLQQEELGGTKVIIDSMRFFPCLSYVIIFKFYLDKN